MHFMGLRNATKRGNGSNLGPLHNILVSGQRDQVCLPWPINEAYDH